MGEEEKGGSEDRGTEGRGELEEENIEVHEREKRKGR
jgi:hypothetical protein